MKQHPYIAVNETENENEGRSLMVSKFPDLYDEPNQRHRPPRHEHTEEKQPAQHKPYL